MKNLFLRSQEATDRLILATVGVANLLHFKAGRVNELWNVVDLVALIFFLELIPTQAGNHISGNITLIACTVILAFR